MLSSSDCPFDLLLFSYYVAKTCEEAGYHPKRWSSGVWCRTECSSGQRFIWVRWNGWKRCTWSASSSWRRRWGGAWATAYPTTQNCHVDRGHSRWCAAIHCHWKEIAGSCLACLLPLHPSFSLSCLVVPLFSVNVSIDGYACGGSTQPTYLPTLKHWKESLVGGDVTVRP